MVDARFLGGAALGRRDGGIHHENTYAAFDVPEAEFESLAAIAVGYAGDASALPTDLAAKEVPNSRKSQLEFVFSRAL